MCVCVCACVCRACACVRVYVEAGERLHSSMPLQPGGPLGGRLRSYMPLQPGGPLGIPHTVNCHFSLLRPPLPRPAGPLRALSASATVTPSPGARPQEPTWRCACGVKGGALPWPRALPPTLNLTQLQPWVPGRVGSCRPHWISTRGGGLY